MKKALALLLVLAVFAGFTGCGKTSGEVNYAKEPDFAIPERGKIEGNVYESEYSGIRFEKPDGWKYATNEELGSVDSGAGSTYEMLCQDPETGSHVAIIYEELLITAGNITVTEEEYIDAISENMYNSGLDIMNNGDMTIGGKGYKFVEVYGESEEISINQYSIARKAGNIMISVIITAFNDDSASDILERLGAEVKEDEESYS